MEILICAIVTLLNDNWCFLLLLMGVVRVKAAGYWSELRGGCFWEVYNVLVLC